MYHRNYTTYLNKELDFLKLLVSRFHEQEHVNDLELGVAMQRIQEIYEHFLRIKLIPDAIASESPTTLPQLVETIKSDVVEKRITETVKQPEIEQPPAAEPLPVIVSAPEKNVVVKEEKKEVTPVREEKKHQVETPKATILADKLSQSSDSLPINETLAQQKALGNDLSSKLQTAPLSSIASGIGLNDRFLFTRELFRNDRNRYDTALKYLDNVDSLEDALDFIRRHFDWDEKSETTQKFVSLLYRRHGGS